MFKVNVTHFPACINLELPFREISVREQTYTITHLQNFEEIFKYCMKGCSG